LQKRESPHNGAVNRLCISGNGIFWKEKSSFKWNW